MYHYHDLQQALEDMLAQDSLYRPTIFWEDASSVILREICEQGIDHFRSLPSSLVFFVPTYGTPGNSITFKEVALINAVLKESPPKSVQTMRQFLSGELSALNDYRVLMAADNSLLLPILHSFSESKFGSPIEQFEFDGRRFSRSALNYLLGLVMLKRHLGDEPLRTVLEVGGGFGTLGEIIASAGLKDWRYIDIDIPPTSFVAESYLRSAVGSELVIGYTGTRDRNEIIIDSLPPVSVLCSWQIEKLRGKVDLFVNFISFQEMEPNVVANYLGHIKRLGARWILLRNMREGKQLRHSTDSVGVNVPITTEDYLTLLSGYELVERNIHPFGFRTVDGYHSELLLLKRL
jgi:putative sugar O-methyltransferase